MAQEDARGPNDGRKDEAAGPINEQQIGAEFAKAFQELARGEQTAASLEGRLDDIESRIEQLLASAEEHARQTASLRSEGDNTDHQAKSNSRKG